MHYSRGALRLACGPLLCALLAACPAPPPPKNPGPKGAGGSEGASSGAASQPAPAPAKRYPGYFEGALPTILAKPLEGLDNKPLSYNPPKVEQLALKNGIKVYLVEDHQLPTVDIAFLNVGGEVHVPPGKEGLADLASAVWRSGGTKSRASDVLDRELEDRAAGLSVGIGPEASSIRMSLMSRDLSWGLSLLAEVVTAPAFPQTAIDLERPRIEEELIRQDDDPGSIAFNLLDERFYGAKNPWGRRATVGSLATVTRQDILDFYGLVYNPQRARLVITGDVKKDEILPQLEKAFGKWKPALKPLPKVEAPGKPSKTEVIYIEMPLPQTTFLIGMPAVGRKHPEQEVLSVFNDILGGGGFDSLLMEEIRSNRGLAYGVSSDLDVAGESGGMLTIVGQTKAGSTVESISLALKILENLRSGPPLAEATLERAKNSTLNSFVFRFVSPFSLALQEATYDLFGFQKDYIASLPPKIESITPAQLGDAAKRNIDSSKMILIVVGYAGRFDRPLSALGLGTPTELPAPNRGFLIRP